jgi:hypothetical protein
MLQNTSVSRIVCATFIGPPPQVDCSARHINGDRKDNRPGNLRWSEHRVGTIKPRMLGNATWQRRIHVNS